MLVCSKALHVCAWLNICYKLLTGPMCYCHPWYSDGKMCDTHQNIHLTGTHTDTREIHKYSSNWRYGKQHTHKNKTESVWLKLYLLLTAFSSCCSIHGKQNEKRVKNKTHTHMRYTCTLSGLCKSKSMVKLLEISSPKKVIFLKCTKFKFKVAKRRR